MNHNLTYRELKAALNELPDSQLDYNVSIFMRSSESMYNACDTVLVGETSIGDDYDCPEDLPIIRI